MKRFLLSLVLIPLLSIPSFASHLAGGTIRVQNIGGFTYEVTLILYRDCSGILPPGTAALNFNDTVNSINNFSASLIQTGGPTNTSMSCSTVQTTCNGGSLLGVEAVTYKTTVTLPPGKWRISYTTCCRNPNSTMNAPTSNSFYVYTLLNNTIAQPNQLPVFKQHPRFIASTGFPGIMNYTVSDFDGDSIAYKLTDALDSWNSPLTYLAGTGSGQSPFTLAFPVSLPVNAGYLSYSVSQQMTAVVAVIVEEWRNVNGTMTKLSETLLDHEVFFIQYANHDPVLSGMDTSLTAGYTGLDTSFAAVAIANSNFSFAIWGNDLNPSTGSTPNGGTFIISRTDTIPGSTFTTYYDNTDSSYAIFSWTPTMQDTGKVTCFSVLIADSACPYIGTSLYNYCFLVLDSGAVSLVSSMNGNQTNQFCNNQSITLAAPDGWDSYLWSTGHQTQIITLDSSDLVLGLNILTCQMRKDEYSYTATTEVIMENCAGIGEDLKMEYTVFPNPTTSSVTIGGLSSSQTYHLELMNVQSQVLRTVSVSNGTSYELSLEGLAPGAYIVRLTDGQRAGYSRIVKQ